MKAKKAMTKEPMLFMEGNEKADEMAKEGADVDGGHMEAGRALGHQCVNVCCALSHVQVEECRDTDEISAKRESFVFVDANLISLRT